MATVVSFKAFCATEPMILRRINFPVDDITFSKLQSKLSQLFNIKDFEIGYIDEEDDLIAVDNDLSLNEAIRHVSSLSNNERLVMRLSLKPTTNSNDLSGQCFKDLQESASEQSSTKTLQTHNDDDSKLDQQDNNDERRSREEFPFENVLNTSIKMVHNFVAQLSSAIERDLSNLNLSIPRQQNCGEVPRETLNSQTQTENNQTHIPELQSLEPVEHPGVICDNCHKHVRGVRWKCISCSNYDLCQVCKTKKPNVHSHEFRPIPYPIHPNHNSRKDMHSATCDYCCSVIFGTRHKCINCPDFDLCDLCISLAPTQHPNHTFVQIHRPGDPEIRIPDAAFHPGIRCDGCGKSINGVRFKCGNCADFDLCGNCEASPTNEHDPNHVFIKFKRPVPLPISSTKPLLPNFYSRLEPKSYQKENRQPKPQRPRNNENAPESSPRKSPEKSDCFIPIVRPPTESVEPRFSSAPTALYGPPNKYVSLDSSSTFTYVEEPQSPTLDTSTSTPAPPSKEALPPYSIPNSSTEVKQRNPTLNAQFVDDVNIPDGTVLEPLTQFHKIWRMANNGDINWPEGTVLLYVGGQRMVSKEIFGNKEIEFPVGPVAVGGTINITADLQAPSEPGKHTSYWCLDDGKGNKFGHRVWCDIVVEAEDQSPNMSASSMIFPVLNSDQKSVPLLSERDIDQIEVPISSEEPESPTSTIADFLSNRTDVDVNSVISEEYDDDEESDTNSIVSSNYSAQDQDFIVVEKDSDDETDLPRQSLNEVRPVIVEREESSVISSSNEGCNSSVNIISKDEIQELECQDELVQLLEMGFKDTELNRNLLKLHNGKINDVIEELINC